MGPAGAVRVRVSGEQPVSRRQLRREVKGEGAMNRLHVAMGTAALSLLSTMAGAQVPANIEAGLKKIGQIVDPGCTAKLYRPLMPANDINSKAMPLYKGIDIARDVSFGPNPKDVVDIFSAD